MTFNNRATMKEKVEQLRNDQRNASTLHQFASSEAGEIGGRFAKPATVNASQSAVHYPRLPTSSPWSSDPVPPEEPLGIDVSEAPIVGEPHEVLASQQPFSWLRDRSSSLSCNAESAGVDSTTAVSPSSSSGTPPWPDDGLGNGPHVARGEDKHGQGGADVLSSPNKSKPKLRRRLI
jgi:hypothetical protein